MCPHIHMMILFAALTVVTTIINVMLSLGAAFESGQVKHEKTGVSVCKWSQCFPPVTSRPELNTHLYSCVHQDTACHTELQREAEQHQREEAPVSRSRNETYS